MPKKGTRRKWFLRGLLCGVVLLLALFFGGIAYMRYEAERLIVNRLEVRSDEWTLPPLKVAVAADFHVARDPDDMARLRRIVERINAEKPDLILLPGDFAAGLRPGQSAEPQEIADELAKLQAPLGVYAVLGNHDHWQGKENFIRAFEKAGIPLLENRSLELEFRGGRFLLAGVVDGWTQEKADWDVLLPTDRLPRIVLTHAPDIFDDMPEPTALAVAGHTHGGQIAIPFYGPPMLPSRYHRRYASGLVREGRNTIFVTVGTGTSILPLRFLCPPEIAVLTLSGTPPAVPEPEVGVPPGV